MAGLTSKSTVWPCATAPRIASTGPSIAGWVFQVTVRSSQLQLLIAWRAPPVTLCALVTFATCNRRWAEETRRGPTPLTLTRRKVRCTPVVPGAVFGVWTQLVAGSHESSVQTFASLQLGGGPPTHVPPAQVSAVVQALPSVHGSVFGVWTQPVAELQESVVHTLPSSQLSAGPPTQTPLAQTSAVVQALPSLQGAMVGVAPPHTPAPLQVVPVKQGSVPVQGAPAGSNWQAGPQQLTATAIPSSHCSPGPTTPLPRPEHF